MMHLAVAPLGALRALLVTPAAAPDHDPVAVVVAAGQAALGTTLDRAVVA